MPSASYKWQRSLIGDCEMSFSGLMYLCGFVCLILAPFTGLTVVGAAAFFVIAWVIDHA